MSRVVLYEKGIRNLFANPRGPVAKIVEEKARRIEQNALGNIQRRLDSRTGDLVQSMRRVPILDPRGYRVVVGADAQHRGFNYARALETRVNPDTGVPMNFHKETAFMIPAVRQSGFRPRSV